MILISHRGNIDGKVIDYENNPDYIDKAIFLGYDVEIDLRFFNNNYYLGHDECQYKIDMKWLLKEKINYGFIVKIQLQLLNYLISIKRKISF